MNRSMPANSAGTMAFFSRWYSAGDRKAQIWWMMIGEASTSPTASASFIKIMIGSVGLRTVSFPSGRYGSIGCFRKLIRLSACTSHRPTPMPITRAPSARKIRRRSSSR